MPKATAPARAVGRLTPDGPWVGFVFVQDGHRLVFGLDDGTTLLDSTADPIIRRAGLVAAAIAYVLASLAPAPPDREATQADLAGLIASLAARMEGAERGAAQEALDAIDDGIQPDSVAIRLQQLLPAGVDAVEFLKDRWARLLPG